MDVKKITNYLSTLADKMIYGESIDLTKIARETKEKEVIGDISRKATLKKLLSEQKIEDAKTFIIQNNMQNIVDSTGTSLLTKAIATNNYEFVNYLIENGSKITAKELEYCSSNDVLLSIMSCLINKLTYTDIDSIDEASKIAISNILDKAISDNELELATLIYVSNLYDQNYDVLSKCIKYDNIDFAKYVLKLGFNAKSNVKKYFNQALSSKNLNFLKLMFKYDIQVDKDEISEILQITIRKKENLLASIIFDSKKYSKMYDVLKTCIDYDNVYFAKYILERGFDVNFNSEYYFNMALRKPTLDFLELLLKYNIVIDKENSATILTQTICEKNNELAILLFDNELYSNKHDLLQVCFTSDNLSFAEYILSKNYKVKFNQIFYFNTALKKESLEWLKLLIKYNMALEPKDMSKLLTDSICNSKNNLATVIFDSKTYLPSHDVLNDCLIYENLIFADYILNNGFDVNFNTATYLKAALLKTTIDCLKLLIEHNIDLSEYGTATMNYAIELEKILTVRLLGKAGVKIKEAHKKCASVIQNKSLILTIIDLCEDTEEIKKIFDLALDNNFIVAKYIMKKYNVEISFNQKLKYFFKYLF